MGKRICVFTARVVKSRISPIGEIGPSVSQGLPWSFISQSESSHGAVGTLN
jgi:hypothetical protein